MANGSFYRAKHELCFVFNNPQAKALWNDDLLDEGGFYKTNNELVFIFKNDDAAKHLSHLDLSDRIRTNVWNYPSAVSTANPDRLELKNHPTPKPVAMVADSILDTTNEGDIIIDWFLGSGTALIAAEKTNRWCYATEIEPLYIQQIINRYVCYCKKNKKHIWFKHINGNITLNQICN
jgi:DNA modification methylase